MLTMLEGRADPAAQHNERSGLQRSGQTSGSDPARSRCRPRPPPVCAECDRASSFAELTWTPRASAAPVPPWSSPRLGRLRVDSVPGGIPGEEAERGLGVVHRLGEGVQRPGRAARARKPRGLRRSPMLTRRGDRWRCRRVRAGGLRRARPGPPSARSPGCPRAGWSSASRCACLRARPSGRCAAGSGTAGRSGPPARSWSPCLMVGRSGTLGGDPREAVRRRAAARTPSWSPVDRASRGAPSTHCRGVGVPAVPGRVALEQRDCRRPADDEVGQPIEGGVGQGRHQDAGVPTSPTETRRAMPAMSSTVSSRPAQQAVLCSAQDVGADQRVEGDRAPRVESSSDARSAVREQVAVLADFGALGRDRPARPPAAA